MDPRTGSFKYSVISIGYIRVEFRNIYGKRKGNSLTRIIKLE